MCVLAVARGTSARSISAAECSMHVRRHCLQSFYFSLTGLAVGACAIHLRACVRDILDAPWRPPFRLRGSIGGLRLRRVLAFSFTAFSQPAWTVTRDTRVDLKKVGKKRGICRSRVYRHQSQLSTSGCWLK